VNLYLDAHEALISYFENNISHIERDWFNIISPKNVNIEILKKLLQNLKRKFDK